ncbi:hypothetical protein [Reinekea blandensis]|uniref:Lipoprotein n=1 Tax=Reinekea blandensis MED297 TaxID=314283 RepID=A4B9R9_9GAMM|nr:hypothetical protein [Reinekea blandensis]EAR11370.1 hypothetical protein MED297_20822 [Reinekea sp. MED297] [Reinekea blandensis MED297]
MKKAVTSVALLATLTGCASLPVPTPESNNAILAVPVVAENDSNSTGYAYGYVMRMMNQETNERTSFNIKPQNGTRVKIIDDLPPGSYCFDGYFSRPEKKDGYRYTYDSEYLPYESCFELEASTLTVWQNKVAVYVYTDEKDRRSTWQRHAFTELEESERENVEARLLEMKNIELWQPIVWSE